MKEFQPLADLLAAVKPAAKDFPAPESRQRQLARCWRNRAGAAALHGRPLLFTSGRLVVFVEFASWGNEIRHRSRSLMEALAGDGIPVNAVEVKILPDSLVPPAPPARPRQPAQARPALSPRNAEQIEQLAQTIEHPRLKASLLRLAKRAHHGRATDQTAATVGTKAMGTSDSSS